MSPEAEDMQPSLPPVVLVLLVTLATSAPLPASISLTLVARNMRTLELLLAGDTFHQEEEVRQKRGARCVLHCLALGHLHPAQCHQLC